MSTTTLKIPDALKVRIADAAQQAGKSAHAFMLEALEAETRRAENATGFRQLGAKGRAGGCPAWRDVRDGCSSSVLQRQARGEEPQAAQIYRRGA